MGDVLGKLRILHVMAGNTFREWEKHVWRRELDKPYCCDGRECGCGAVTVRECYSWKVEQ